MEKCKFCQAELEEGVTLCPVCGKDNAEAVTEPAPVELPPMQDIPETMDGEQAAAETAAEEVSGEAASEAEAQEGLREEAEADAPAEETAEEKKQVSPGKIALAVAAIVVLVAVLAALIFVGTNTPVQAETDVEATVETVPAEAVSATIPADGEPGTITEKGTYTVTDEEAKAMASNVVATVGDRELTNAQLQVYYWMEVQSFLSEFAAYASYFGLDYTKPLDTQISMEAEDMTWQHYFLQSALFNWQQIQAMGIEAEKAGMTISQEDLDYLETIPGAMEQNAALYSMSLEEYLLKNIGPAAGMEEFVNYQREYRSGVPYYNAEVAKFVPTEADLEAYFAEKEESYAESGLTKDSMLVAVRHILLQPESAAGDGTFTDAEWEACREAAQAVLDQWKAGDKTEDSFAALANEHSTDPGSNTNGGLYEDVYVGQMVQPFNDWCFDASRQYGDTDLVKTDYGYHVMFFVGSEPQWKQVAESDWVNTQINALFDRLGEDHPMEVKYDQIALGYVAMG